MNGMVQLFQIKCRTCIHRLAGLLLLLCAVPGLADLAASQEFDQLRAQLEGLGWKVERSAAGDLLLWPPGEPSAAAPAAVAVEPDSADGETIAVTDIKLLRQRLAEKGWDVRTSDDGSLTLYPKAAGITATETTNSAVAPPLETASKSDHFEEVRALLVASGWRVERNQAGDLMLYPGAGAETGQRQESTLLQVDSTDLERVRDALLAAGWRLSEAADGTLLLYPAANQGSQRKAAVFPSLQPDPVASGEVELPVDQWGEAHRLAVHWLEWQSRSDLSIGKIRKVNWVYLVSIVEKSPPFRLNNQLAIRVEDGQVIPLY